MQLWKHKNGTWYVLHGPRLKSRVSARTKDRKEAEVFFSQFIATEGSIVLDDPTMREILEAYRDDRKTRVRGVRSLEFSVGVLIQHLGDLQPTHLTPAAVRGYVEKRKVGNGTVLREVGALRASLAWAIEHRMIKVSPVISNPVAIPPPRRRWLSKPEAKKLLASCVEPHVRTFITVALMTAARSGAILEAKWDQVDWDRKIIDFGDGHGNKHRAVAPINADLEKTLRAAHELACTDYIIEWRGKRLKSIKNGFAQACRRAKIGEATPHDLRRSAATWMAMGGVPLAEMAKMLGDTEKMVEETYAKFTPEYLVRASKALELSQ